jgi:protein ImuB
VDWPLLLEQLQARLGAGAVRGLKIVEDHRPEQAWGYTDPGSRMHTSHNRRPLWLLPIPRPLASRGGNPWWRGYLSIIVGPERIENGWWDGRDISRDYYIAMDTDGSRLWIFRELCRDRWYLHGLFG